MALVSKTVHSFSISSCLQAFLLLLFMIFFSRIRFLDAMDPEKMFSDNALVSVVNIGPQHYAMCETPFMLQVNTESLETEERVRCLCFFFY